MELTRVLLTLSRRDLRNGERNAVDVTNNNVHSEKDRAIMEKTSGKELQKQRWRTRKSEDRVATRCVQLLLLHVTMVRTAVSITVQQSK